MPFPNVPIAPGVPQLPRDPNSPPGTIPLITGDSIETFGEPGAPQWGIFLEGSPVVIADNVLSFSYRNETTLSDYPIEGGGFESYDKVQTPADARFRFSAGGNLVTRQNLLQSVKDIAGSLAVYDVVTPEESYPSFNVSHYDYDRTSGDGAGLIVIDVWLIEVRLNAQAQFTQTQAPAGADPVQQGTLQPLPPTPAQATAAASAGGGSVGGGAGGGGGGGF